MKNIILPTELFCPFESAINPNVLNAEQKTCAWLQAFNLIKSPEVLEFYRTQGFAYMVARMFPSAPAEILYALTDLNTLLFLVDDQLDHQESNSNIRQNPSQLKKQIMSTLRHGLFSKTNTPLLTALDDINRRLKGLSNGDWHHQFVKSISHIFDAAIWQENNIRKGENPLLFEYQAWRRFLGAANVATWSILIAAQIRFSPSVQRNPVIQELTVICENTVCTANDLFSLSKELNHLDYYNTVVILQREDCLDQDEAIAKTIEIHDRNVSRFIKLTEAINRIITSTTQQRIAITSYITGLKSLMRGNIDWSNKETTRHHYSYADSNYMLSKT